MVSTRRGVRALRQQRGVTLIRGLCTMPHCIKHDAQDRSLTSWALMAQQSIAPQSWPDAERAPAASYPLFNIIGYVKLLVRACTCAGFKA